MAAVGAPPPYTDNNPVLPNQVTAVAASDTNIINQSQSGQNTQVAPQQATSSEQNQIIVNPNIVVNAQATAATVVVAQPQHRDWNTGICGCVEDCTSFCYALWCYECFLCSLSSKLHEFPCGPSLCPCLFTTAMRTKARTMYRIRGSILQDICCVCCCPFCAMTQIWRELDSVGPEW